ncbi:MAG TPA: SprT family zinc-dependent metalloprotease [Anaerolineae bacterium]|nr:SprT family zinc-dependent metalloprotease [Anaerolineae bacterium]
MRQTTVLVVDDIEIDVVRKKIKNVNISVRPPDGQVRLSAPHHVSLAQIRQIVRQKKSWIKSKQAKIKAHPPPPPLKMVAGEIHYVWGRPYALALLVGADRERVVLGSNGRLHLHLREGSNIEHRQKLLTEWYRALIKVEIPPLIAKWEPIIGRKVADWGVKKMKTRWGTCNIGARRIWLNLELAKKPPACLEFIVVHEMVHLLERYHNGRFYTFMDQFMPDWRQYEAMLNSRPD